jgi:hypothetical protein
VRGPAKISHIHETKISLACKIHAFGCGPRPASWPSFVGKNYSRPLWVRILELPLCLPPDKTRIAFLRMYRRGRVELPGSKSTGSAHQYLRSCQHIESTQILLQNHLAQIDESNRAGQLVLVEERVLLLISQHLQRGFAQNGEIESRLFRGRIGEHKLMRQGPLFLRLMLSCPFRSQRAKGGIRPDIVHQAQSLSLPNEGKKQPEQMGNREHPVIMVVKVRLNIAIL